MKIRLGKFIFRCLPVCGLVVSCQSTDKLEISREPSQAGVTYSQQKQLPQAEWRQYQRMTKDRLEKENELYAQSGSLWVMEGQTGYLFAQNKMRKEGDILPVTLEGPLLDQVRQKIKTIKKLMDEIEKENEKYLKASAGHRGLAQESAAEGGEEKKVETDSSVGKAADDKMELEPIMARITERLPDGAYRVRGQRHIMVNDKEFKVLVTGMVRPEDFSDQGISSNRLLDSDVDVLSVRKKRALAAEGM
jgi:flagellar L-ring protein precursor FlgH